MNTPPALHILPAAVNPNFGHALGGIWRLTVCRLFSPRQTLVFLLLLGLLALLTGLSVGEGDTAQFLQWVINGFLTALVPVTAFLSGAGAIRDDMKGVAVDYILTRPVRRMPYVMGKYLCHVVCVLGLQLVALAVLFGVGLDRGVPDLGALVPDLVLALVVAVVAFTALGFMAGAATARYLVLGITYAGIIEVGISRIPIQLSKLSVLHHVKTLLAGVAPDIAGTFAASGSAWVSVAFVTVLTAFWVAGAALLFARQEFAGQRPKEG